MLEHLFGSKTRTKLLTLFLHRPDQVFYVRELTRLINTQINAVRRELDNLVLLGLVVEAEEQVEDPGVRRPGVKRKYYKTNAHFTLLTEIRMLVTKAYILLERQLGDEVSRLGSIRYLALMGSFIGKTGSPVDLFIVGDIDLPATRALVARLEEDLGFEINFTSMTVQEFTYRREILDRFLSSILESPKNVLIDELPATGSGGLLV